MFILYCLFAFRHSMEAHAVHYNAKYADFQEASNKPDGLAVCAFFIQACGDKDCPEFKKITEGIRNVRFPKTKCAADSGELANVHLYQLKCFYRLIRYHSPRLSLLDGLTRAEQTLLHI